VVLMRHTSQTHMVDSDQRAVELPVTGREGRPADCRVAA
jgi:hypothetical protein